MRIQARVRTSTVQSRFAKMKAAALTLQSRFRVYVQQRLYSSFIRRNRNSGGEHQHEESRPGLRESYSICNNVHAHVEQIRKAQRDAAAAVAAAEAAASGEMRQRRAGSLHARRKWRRTSSSTSRARESRKLVSSRCCADGHQSRAIPATHRLRVPPIGADRMNHQDGAQTPGNVSARTVILTKMAPGAFTRESLTNFAS